MILRLEAAKQYFLVPFKDENSLFLIGGKAKMDYLASIMNDGDVVAVCGDAIAGGVGDKCFLIVEYNNDKCLSKIKEADELLMASLKSNARV